MQKVQVSDFAYPHWRQPKNDLNNAETLIGQWFEEKNKTEKSKKL